MIRRRIIRTLDSRSSNSVFHILFSIIIVSSLSINSVSCQNVYSPILYPSRDSPFSSKVVLGDHNSQTEFGKFTPWSEASKCSRECGGGVAMQTRACLNETACLGPTIRYFSCNTQPCPPGTLDFRTQQCVMFNKIPYWGKTRSWVPYYPTARNPCSLVCRPTKEFFYATLSEKVVDGTRCYHEEESDSRDICVDGHCLPVGCDGNLGSNKTEDKCRVCDGNGRDCKTIREIHSNQLSLGYNDIVMIPQSATNIRITELAPTRNFLAVRGENKTFYLNGNWTVNIAVKKFKAGGAKFTYERKPDKSPVGPVAESLFALGPLKEPIYIVVVHQEQNPGFEYEYSVHRDVPIPALNAANDTYQYIFGDFGPCSKTCGGGQMQRIVRCVQLRYGKIVSLDKCDPKAYQKITAPCNNIPCAPAYHTGKWSKCICPGYRHRNVFCEKILEQGERRVLDENECEGMERPPALKECSKDSCVPLSANVSRPEYYDNNWTVGEWSDCDAICGSGKRNRTIACLDDYGKEVNETMCEGEKPPAEEACDLVPCEFTDWVTSEWSDCSKNCASGVATRKVYCATEDGKVYADSYCDQNRRPNDTMICPENTCEGTWFTSEWSHCSAECGIGIRSRSVVCGRYLFGNQTERNVLVTLNSTECSAPKPNESESCDSKVECRSLEFVGPWSECVCEKQSRKTMCINLSQVSEDCNKKLSAERDCKVPELVSEADSLPANVTNDCCLDAKGCCPNGSPITDGLAFCPRELHSITSETDCSVSPFGCCPETSLIAIGPFKLGCRKHCLATRFGCCGDGITPAEDKTLSTCVSACFSSEFGCCPDNKTISNADQSNCNIEKKEDAKKEVEKDGDKKIEKKEPDEIDIEGSGEVEINLSSVTPAVTSPESVDESTSLTTTSSSLDE